NGGAWTGFGAIFRAFYSWGSAKGKPLMVSETGTAEDLAEPGRKRGWFTDAAATLTRELPRIRAVVYYDQGGRCDWRPDTSSPSMRGFVRFPRDPFFGPRAAFPATTASVPTTSAAPTTASSTVRPTTAAPTTPVAPTTTTV